MYLNVADQKIIEQAIKAGVAKISTFYEGMIPETDYQLIAAGVVAAINHAHPQKSENKP